MQVLAILPKFSIQWPESLRKMFSWFSILNFNLELVHPECMSSSGWDWYSKWTYTLLAPIFILALICLFLAFRCVAPFTSLSLSPFLVRFLAFPDPYPACGALVNLSLTLPASISAPQCKKRALGSLFRCPLLPSSAGKSTPLSLFPASPSSSRQLTQAPGLILVVPELNRKQSRNVLDPPIGSRWTAG